MRAGAPVLDSHSAWSTDAIRAVVDKVWLSGPSFFGAITRTRSIA
jgi:hypothetical protein